MEKDRLDRIETKIDKMNDKLSEVSANIAAQRVGIKDIAKDVGDQDRRLRPIEKHVGRVEGAVKLISVLAVALGIVKTVLTLTAGH